MTIFFFFWKLELRSLVTFFLQENIYSRVGKWQEGWFKMKMLPNWSLHLNKTHGVTMDSVLRTQNICLFVELEETKLFSLVNVNSKNHIFVHALWWPFLLTWFYYCHGTPAISFFSLLFQMKWTAWGFVPCLFLPPYFNLPRPSCLKHPPFSNLLLIQ